VRVAYVCPDRGVPFLGFKGASVHAREITSALQARGHEVFAAFATLGEGNPPPGLSGLSVMPEDDDERETFLKKLLAEERVDAVIERYSLQVGPGCRASRSVGVPQLLEVNAPIVLEAAKYRGYSDVDRSLQREREAFAAADVITVVSSPLSKYVSSIVPDAKVSVVPNGVNPARFSNTKAMDLGFSTNPVVVGFVGSLKPWHGVEDLLDALEMVGGSEIHLVIAGTGPEEDRLRQRAESSGNNQRVHFLHSIAYDRVPSVLVAIDIAAAPYRPSEDFYFCPIKVFEYMAAGKPVAFPELGDLPGLIDGAGIAFSPGSIEQLAQSIERLASEPELRKRLGDEGRSRAAEFTWDVAAAKVEALLISSHTRSAK
jgi:glycosyltransferase involved in cell wall biosynthesis